MWCATMLSPAALPDGEGTVEYGLHGGDYESALDQSHNGVWHLDLVAIPCNLRGAGTTGIDHPHDCLDGGRIQRINDHRAASPTGHPILPTFRKAMATKAPGEADKNAPQRWEVSSYVFVPGFITVQQGDTVTLNAFVVNGDHHEVFVTAPDGQVAAPTATWQRGRQYQMSFVAEKVGAYQLTCATHTPTMTATIQVLPR